MKNIAHKKVHSYDFKFFVFSLRYFYDVKVKVSEINMRSHHENLFTLKLDKKVSEKMFSVRVKFEIFYNYKKFIDEFQNNLRKYKK